MSMRIAPPGRRSSSQTGFVNPCGPHHCATYFGSVHASNTSARGASMMRVRTSSEGAGADEVVKAERRFAVLPLLRLSAAMFGLLGLKCAEVILQAIDALVPESAVLLHPSRDFAQRHRLESAGPPLRVATARDQAGALQHLQVLGNGGGRHFEGRGQLLGRRPAGGESRENPPASRAG